jgi:AcrR family transcriptional regulator
MTTTRRSTAEVRADLIVAAGHLFATGGYAGTSTKEIAQRAGVYETSIYTHFGSKAGVFSAAVVEPFTEFIESFGRALADHRGASDAALVRAFVDYLYDALDEHHDAVMAFVLVMGEAEAGDALTQARASLDAMFEHLREAGSRRDAAAGRPGPGRPITQRLMIALVVASQAFAPWLFPDEVSKQAIKDAMVQMLLEGVRTPVEG